MQSVASHKRRGGRGGGGDLREVVGAYPLRTVARANLLPALGGHALLLPQPLLLEQPGPQNFESLGLVLVLRPLVLCHT